MKRMLCLAGVVLCAASASAFTVPGNALLVPSARALRQPALSGLVALIPRQEGLRFGGRLSLGASRGVSHSLSHSLVAGTFLPAAVKIAWMSTDSGGGWGGDGISRRSGGGGGGGEGGDEEAEEELAALLQKTNLKLSDLPAGARALPTAILCRFISAFSNPVNRFLIEIWPAWRDKMIADPEFAYKMFVEETVGLGLAMAGTAAARGKVRAFDALIPAVCRSNKQPLPTDWIQRTRVRAAAGEKRRKWSRDGATLTRSYSNPAGVGVRRTF